MEIEPSKETPGEENMGVPEMMEKKEHKKKSPIEKLVNLRSESSRARSVQSLTKSLMKPLADIDIEELKEKLEDGADPNGDPDKWGEWRPIFWAATSGNYSVLSLLLSDERTKINVTDSNGYTVLHHAVISACRKIDKDGSFYRCIDLLMENPNLKLNIPDKKGYTALGRAVVECHKKCVEQILKHPSVVRLNLDYTMADRDSTLREIILKTFPELGPLLPHSLKEDMASPENDIRVLASLQHGQYNSFRQYLQTSNPNPWYAEPYHSTLLELACQMKNREEFLSLLFHNGANPNIKNRITGIPLLHITASSGCFDNLLLLLQRKDIDTSVKDNENCTILHYLARIRYKLPDDKEKVKKCLELLLEKGTMTTTGNPVVKIDDEDSSGNTALHIAASCEHRDRILLFLRYGADFIVTRHGKPILLLMSANILEEILDDCVETNNEPVTGIDFKLTFNHDFLPNLLVHMSEISHLRHLLRHPAILTFLSLKWRQIKVFFILDLLLYVLFVLFLTIYILLSDYNKEISTSKIFFQYYKYPDMATFNESKMLYKIGDSTPEYLWYPLTIFMGMLTLRELFQLFMYGRKYFISPENWLEILLIVASLLSCSGIVKNESVQLHSSAIAVLLAWLELVVLAGKLPLLSVQVEMLKTVSWTFLRFMAGYILLIIAFSLSFFILFRNSTEHDGEYMYTNPFLSMLKTIVMFTGELEASSLMFDTVPYTSHIIFIAFVFVVPIVLLNLLNGLAVNDTGTIRKDAEILSLVARVRLINKIEKVTDVLPKCFSFTNNFSDIYSLYPNRRNSIDSSSVLESFRLVSRKKKKEKKNKGAWDQQVLNVLMDRIVKVQEQQEEIQKRIDAKFEETQQILMNVIRRLDAADLTDDGIIC
ncbi:hypothetical protein C0J52_12395 [Blattella germanica]|nr:hypothetical protein C0J52_12395 [Blattella germanica]